MGGPSISARRDRKILKDWRDYCREVELEGKIGTHREGREEHAKQKEQHGKGRTGSLVIKAGRR